MSKECFVIPEISHIKNEGIPLLIYNYIESLIKNKHEITVLYTSTCDSLEFEYWEKKYTQIGARFQYLNNSEINASLSATDLFFRSSYAVYKRLENSSFDIVHFSDFYASGFHTIQAKRNTSLFKNTTLTVLLQEANEYICDCRGTWCDNPIFDMRLQYAERYCCEYADVLIGSAELLTWAKEKKWHLTRQQYVINNSFNMDERAANFLHDFHNESLKRTVDNSDKPANPKVSVCIAYYNHGKYLPMMLESLEKSTYSNFEVIVVNDGSTDKYSITVFEEMEKKYKSKPYKFFSKNNEYMGKTRNFAVAKSSGEYIIFVDSDDIVSHDMIEKFVYGIINSSCDCLSAYMHYFDGDLTLEQSVISEGIYSPTGPVLELTMFENCIGSVNIIIKKEVFLAVGGFSSERYCYEDWRFLIKLALQGYRLDVIPICLYYYRILPNSMNRSKDDYKSKNWLLSVYYDEMPLYMKYLIKSFCMPSWDLWIEKGNIQISDLQNQIVELQEQSKNLRAISSLSLLKLLVTRILNRVFGKRL